MNIFKQYEKLKLENEKLKEKNRELKQKNTALRDLVQSIQTDTAAERSRAQHILLECAAIQQQWEDGISEAKAARDAYQKLYAQCCQLKRMLK
ncbi:hypothetical protein D7Y05_09325 [bacterium 1XD42-54]|nr:hypothetical protein D7Y05_09325 [bacterium 1XD42-54]